MIRFCGCGQGPVQLRGRILHVLLHTCSTVASRPLAEQVRRARSEGRIVSGLLRTGVGLRVGERLDSPLPRVTDAVQRGHESGALSTEDGTNVLVVEVDRRQT